MAPSIKLPAYDDNIEHWLLLVEAIFTNAPADVDDGQKFGLLLGALPTSKVKDVENVLTSPPRTEKCKALIKALKKKIPQQGDEDTFRELLSMQLGDMEPSALLQHMQSLNAKRTAKLPGPVIRSLHLQKLPSSLQSLIETTGAALDDDAYAELADKILRREAAAVAKHREPQLAPLGQVSAVSRPRSTTDLEAQIKDLQQQLATLQAQLKPSTTRDINARQRPAARDLCYYHSRFGKDARNCEQPCSFQGNASSGRW